MFCSETGNTETSPNGLSEDNNNDAADYDEAIKEPVLNADDFDLIKECRAVIVGAKENGSNESIHSAIRHLAVVAQEKLAADVKNEKLRKNRFLLAHIGTAMAEESFSPFLYRVLNSLVNGYEFFSQEAAYHLTFNIFTLFTSYLQSSNQFAVQLFETTDFANQILTVLGYKKYTTQLTQKNIWRFFDACLTTLSHGSQRESIVERLANGTKTLETCQKFMSTGEFGYAGLWLPATVVVAALAHDNNQLLSKTIGKNFSDFVNACSHFVVNFNQDEQNKGDETGRSRTTAQDDPTSSPRPSNATSTMPVGAAVTLVQLLPALNKFLEAVALEPDLVTATQQDLNQLVDTAEFLLELARPSSSTSSESNSGKVKLTLGDWRIAVDHGLDMVVLLFQIRDIFGLEFEDSATVRMLNDISQIASMTPPEATLKMKASKVHDQVSKPKNEEKAPSPMARSVTATIASGNNRRESIASTGPRDDGSSVAAKEVSKVLTWTSDDVVHWIKTIGLEK